jgi:hypothetical protein
MLGGDAGHDEVTFRLAVSPITPNQKSAAFFWRSGFRFIDDYFKKGTWNKYQGTTLSVPKRLPDAGSTTITLLQTALPS